MSDGANRLVLIVEDNDRNLKLARDILQFHGYRTLEAATGEEGVALALEHQPDLVLMDIALPGIDGVEAARRIRAGGTMSATPIIAVTASVMQSDRARLDEAGFAGVIPKPIDVLAFPDQVAGYLTPRGAS